MQTEEGGIIDRYTRQAAQYEHRDGTADLGMAVWFVVFALGVRFSEGVAVTWRSFAIAYGAIFAVWAAVHFGIRYIRARLVYPRSGYAKMRKRPWKLALAGGLAAVAAAALAPYFAGMQSPAPSAPLMISLVISLSMMIGALRTRVRKLVAFAVLSIAIGLALHFTAPTLASGAFWYFLLMGIAFLMSGALTLYLYVRHTQ